MSSRVDPLFPPTASPRLLMGREREQTKLRLALDAAIHGRGSLVLVSGEAGIGKTALVEDLASQAGTSSVLVLKGDCYDLATTPPYGPWIDALSVYEPHGDWPHVPSALRVDGGPHAADSQSELFRQLRTFLDHVATQMPLLLILEDLHWSDRSSLDLMRDVARRIDQSRILLIATWRVDELDRRHPLYRLVPALVREAGGLRIDLRRLDRGAQRALIAARYRLSDDDRERLVDYLCQRTEGNPLFLTELLRTLEEEGLLTSSGSAGWRVGDLTRAPVPELVRQVIEGRVARLGEEVRAPLEIAAVIGHEVPLDLWFEMAGEDSLSLPLAVERLVEAHLLEEVPPNAYRFSHALVRQAIYRGIVLPMRQELHRRAGELLSSRSDPDPDAVAHHFQQAADARAAGWLLRSGVQARRQFAPIVAIERFTAALAGSANLRDDERIQLYLERGRAFETLGELASSVADAETALGLARDAGDWRREWQTLLDLGAAWSPSNYEETGNCYRQALDLARANGDKTTLAVSLNRLGNWCFNVLRLRDALRYHQEAQEVFEGLDDLPNLAQTHDLLAITRWASGDGFRAAEHWDVAMRLFEQLGDRLRLASSSCTSSGLTLVDFPVVATRPLERTFAHVERGLQLAREIGWRPGEVFALHNLGRLHLMRGEVSIAMRHLRDALALAEMIEHQEWTAASWWHIGLALQHVHDLTGAREALERALELSNAIGSRFFGRLAVPSLARTLVDLDELDAAEGLLARHRLPLDADGDEGSLHRSHHCWATASLLLERGDAEHALAIVDGTLASLPNIDRGLVPALSILRGQSLVSLNRLPEARDELAAARAWLARFHERPMRLVACADLGRVLDALGEDVAAGEAIAAAREIAGFMIDQIQNEEMRTFFRAYVSDLLPDTLPRDPIASAGLSTRELEVLRLVAEGLTDVEVARRLFLSRRTVSSHLRSIYGKLDVSTRTAATRVAIERHLI